MLWSLVSRPAVFPAPRSLRLPTTSVRSCSHSAPNANAIGAKSLPSGMPSAPATICLFMEPNSSTGFRSSGVPRPASVQFLNPRRTESLLCLRFWNSSDPNASRRLTCAFATRPVVASFICSNRSYAESRSVISATMLSRFVSAREILPKTASSVFSGQASACGRFLKSARRAFCSCILSRVRSLPFSTFSAVANVVANFATAWMAPFSPLYLSESAVNPS